MRKEQKLRLWRQMTKQHGADRLSKHEWKNLRADFLRSWNTTTFDKFSKDQLAEAALREELQETTVAPDGSMPVTRAYSGLEKGLASRLSTRRRSTKLETNPIATSEGSIPPAQENTGSSQRKPSSLPLVLLGLEKDQTQSSKPSRSAVKAREKPVATPEKFIALPREPTSLENVIYIVQGDQSRLLNRGPNSRGTLKLAPTTDGHIELKQGDQKRSSKASQSRVKTDVKLSAISDGSVPPTQENTDSSQRKPSSLPLVLLGLEKDQTQSSKPSRSAVKAREKPVATPEKFIALPREPTSLENVIYIVQGDQSRLLNRGPNSRGTLKLAPTTDGHIELKQGDQKRSSKASQSRVKTDVKLSAISDGSVPPTQENTDSSQRKPSSLPLVLLGLEKDQTQSSKPSRSAVKAREKPVATPDKFIALPREPTSLENVIYIVQGDQSRLLNRGPNSRGTLKLAPTTDGHIELKQGDQKRSSKASQSRVKTDVKLSAISDGSVPPTQENTGSSKRKPMSLLLDHSEPESTDQSQLLNCRPSSRPRPKLAPTPDGHIELEKRDKKRAPKPTQNPFMREVKSAAIFYSSIPPAQEHTGSSLRLDRAGTEKKHNRYR
ncbi:uncharacterized protein LOC108163323 isoform X9 [Drosophila miranda]|uniref:uncharacterized protein LOC108163323 isoform X9 n=1 Tax=Drosophila miranda TaxID=7229 RepID=UPI00143F32F8|nr:uncharacterized protein LOC108163323 isoform X9 [Drosophila miranda]